MLKFLPLKYLSRLEIIYLLLYTNALCQYAGFKYENAHLALHHFTGFKWMNELPWYKYINTDVVYSYCIYYDITILIFFQEEVYDHTSQFLIPQVIAGYNGTVFAYGATGKSEVGIIVDELPNYVSRQIIKRSRKMLT